MKRIPKCKTYLRCETVSCTTSRAGNIIFVVIFRDHLNRKYRHYISCNMRSKVWLYNLLAGSGKDVDFDNLLMVSEMFHQDPFEFCRGRIYECVWVWEKKFGPIVNEIYTIEDMIHNKQACINLYEKGWYKNLTELKSGYYKNGEDWAGLYFGKAEDLPGYFDESVKSPNYDIPDLR